VDQAGKNKTPILQLFQSFSELYRAASKPPLFGRPRSLRLMKARQQADS
jgi:hypothetical protein